MMADDRDDVFLDKAKEIGSSDAYLKQYGKNYEN